MAEKPHTALRKKPRQSRSRTTVGVILQAATKVLGQEGIDRMTTNRVAEVAGVSVGSVYQYFPNKESMVAALAERHIQEMVATVGTTLRATNPGGVIDRAKGAKARDPASPGRDASFTFDSARHVVQAILSVHAADPAFHRELNAELSRVAILERIRETESRLTDLIRTVIGTKFGNVRPENLDLAAFLLVHMVIGLVHAAVAHRPELLTDPEFADEITEMAMRYVFV